MFKYRDQKETEQEQKETERELEKKPEMKKKSDWNQEIKASIRCLQKLQPDILPWLYLNLKYYCMQF